MFILLLFYDIVEYKIYNIGLFGTNNPVQFPYVLIANVLMSLLTMYMSYSCFLVIYVILYCSAQVIRSISRYGRAVYVPMLCAMYIL